MKGGMNPTDDETRPVPSAQGMAEVPAPQADDTYQRLDRWVDEHFDEEVRFLQELVRVPTDTPPGKNALHAARPTCWR
jgi:hypothetical protein